jgi:hypothetical protein
MAANIQAKEGSFKDAWRESIHDPDRRYFPRQMKIEALAEIAGVSATYLYSTADKGAVHTSKARRGQPLLPSVEILIRVLPNVLNLAVLDYLNRLAHCLPPVREPQPNGSTARVAVEMMAACADTLRKHSDALDNDGEFDADEKRDLFACLDRLIVAAQTMRYQVEQAPTKDASPQVSNEPLRAVGGTR